MTFPKSLTIPSPWQPLTVFLKSQRLQLFVEHIPRVVQPTMITMNCRTISAPSKETSYPISWIIPHSLLPPGNQEFTSCLYRFTHFGLFIWMESHKICGRCHSLLWLGTTCSRFTHGTEHLSGLHLFFFWPNNTPLYGQTTFCRSVHLLMSLRVVSTSWRTVNNTALNIHVQAFVYRYVFVSLLKVPRGGWLGHMCCA